MKPKTAIVLGLSLLVISLFISFIGPVLRVFENVEGGITYESNIEYPQINYQGCEYILLNQYPVHKGNCNNPIHCHNK